MVLCCVVLGTWVTDSYASRGAGGVADRHLAFAEHAMKVEGVRELFLWKANKLHSAHCGLSDAAGSMGTPDGADAGNALIEVYCQ